MVRLTKAFSTTAALAALLDAQQTGVPYREWLTCKASRYVWGQHAGNV